MRRGKGEKEEEEGKEEEKNKKLKEEKSGVCCMERCNPLLPPPPILLLLPLTLLIQDLKADINSSGTQRSLPMDPSSLCSQGVTQSEAGLGNGGFNQGGSGLPLKGIDQPRQSWGSQLQTENMFPFLQESFSPDEGGYLMASPDFDFFDEMSDHINVIESQTQKVKSKSKKKSTSLVWEFYKRIAEKDGKERAQCIKCGVKYLIDSEKIGTSTLNRHVKKCLRNETHDVVQLESMDQGPEPIPEENIIEARTLERPFVPQAHISPSPTVRFDVEVDAGAVRLWTTLSSPASGVSGTTPAVTTKRRRLAEMHTVSDQSIWSKTSAIRPTSHDSANKSAGTEAEEDQSSTPPAATEEVQAPRDPQLSLITTKSGPQEESGSVHKQLASAEELRSIGEQKKALKITLNGILDSLSKGQIEYLGSCKIAADVVLRADWSAVDVKPLEAIFTELFASSKEWQSIQDPVSLYQNEVLDRVAILKRELNEERELVNEEKSSVFARCKQTLLFMQESPKHKEDSLSLLDQHEILAYNRSRRKLDLERELENDELSSWIDRYRETLLDMHKRLEREMIILTEAIERRKGIEARAASKLDRLKTFVSMLEGILGVGLESADPEVAARMYAAHKREVMKAQLQDFSGKINDFFKE